MFISLLEIPRRGSVCAQGKESLTPGMDYYSILLENPEGSGFVRQDFCLNCWEKRDSDPLIKSSWKGKVPLKPLEPMDLQSQEQRIFSLLHEALSSDAPDAKTHALFLALYLARKKKLILRQEIIQEGQPVFLYEVSATEEMIAVPRVNLSASDMKKIQHELTQKLA